MRSRPRDLAADSENRLQSARGRASARGLVVGAREALGTDEQRESGSPLHRAPLSGGAKVLDADSRRSRLSNRNGRERIAADRPDARFATRSGTVPATASADPLRCWRGHLALRFGVPRLRGTHGPLVRSDRRLDAGGDVGTAKAAAGRSGDGLRDRNRVDALVARRPREPDPALADLVIALIDGVAEAERALSERRDRPIGAAGVIPLPRRQSPAGATSDDCNGDASIVPIARAGRALCHKKVIVGSPA